MRWNSVSLFDSSGGSEIIRHERGCQGLEEERQHGEQAGQICTEPSAQSEEAHEEGDHSEEQRDNVEAPCESTEIIVMVRANEGLRHACGRSKVLRWVERQCGARWSAVCVAAVGDTADGEVRPSRWVRRVRDAVGVCLEEEDLVFWVADLGAGQHDEELHHDAAGQDDQGREAEERSSDRHYVGVGVIVNGVVELHGFDELAH
jgi:hypothetical protein